MKTFLKIILVLFLLQISACALANLSLDEKIPNGAIVYTLKISGKMLVSSRKVIANLL